MGRALATRPARAAGCSLPTARLPRGTGAVRYRCFLPDLTGFAGPTCTGPDCQQSTPCPVNETRRERPSTRVGRHDTRRDFERTSLVSCPVNSWDNLLVFFAVGCVALPRVVHAPAGHRALPTTKILRNSSQEFTEHDTGCPRVTVSIYPCADYRQAHSERAWHWPENMIRHEAGSPRKVSPTSCKIREFIKGVAEREGFEPPLPEGKPDFESGAFNRTRPPLRS